MQSRFRRYLPEVDRYRDQVDNFQKQDNVAQYTDNLIVFTGSSSIKLWSSLEQDMAPHHVLNRGFGGSTLYEVNHYFHQLVGKYQPNQVFLYCGENDIAEKVSVEQAFQQFLRFVELCHENIPKAEVVYLSIKPSPANWSLRRKFSALNKRIKSYCESHSLNYLDVASVMLKENGMPDERLYMEDQHHVNQAGYERWKEIIRPALK